MRKCASPDVVWQPFVMPEPGAPPPCDPFGPRVAAHAEALGGVHTPRGAPLPLQIHAECSRWVEERYRICANLTSEPRFEEDAVGALYNVELRDGAWSARRFSALQPAGALEGAFLHLQRWKGAYHKMAYGVNHSMPHLRGSRVFKLSQHGFTPLQLAYDDERGASWELRAPGTRSRSF